MRFDCEAKRTRLNGKVKLTQNNNIHFGKGHGNDVDHFAKDQEHNDHDI